MGVDGGAWNVGDGVECQGGTGGLAAESRVVPRGGLGMVPVTCAALGFGRHGEEGSNIDLGCRDFRAAVVVVWRRCLCLGNWWVSFL